MPTNYFEKLKQPSLEYDNKKKRTPKEWFSSDQAVIEKLRSLSHNDHDNLFKAYQCFFKNIPKPTQASYQIYEELAEFGKLAVLFLEKFKKIIPSPEQQINLESKIIQKLISNNTITFEQALSLNTVQRMNLELEIMQALFYMEIINLDQILAFKEKLTDIQQTNFNSKVIQELIFNNKITIEQVLLLEPEQSEVLISAQSPNFIIQNYSLVNKKPQTSIPDSSLGETSFLSLEEMHDLIKEKKTRRRNLNAFVFSMGKYTKDNLKLISFFKLLAKNINNKEIPTHFQLAIRDKDDSHWFAVDCYLEKGHLYLLILDSALPKKTVHNLLFQFPGSFFKSKTIFCYNGMQIQQADRGCSFFAANFIFRLSNKTEHWEYLKSYLQQHPSHSINVIYQNESNLPYITLNEQELPPSLAFIFKNIQSLRASKALPDILKNTCINKKGQTLRETINANTQKIKTEIGEEKWRNLGITQKTRKYMERLSSYQKLFKLTKPTKSHSIIQGFEIIGGEEGKVIEQIFQSEKDLSILETLVNRINF